MSDQTAVLESEHLTEEERATLLRLARQALEEGVRSRSLSPLILSQFPARLRLPGATFVTLTAAGQLRGCIGSLEAKEPLVVDVQDHAIAAALDDFRFPPVRPEELPHIRIEISRLTTPQPLEYRDPDDLLVRLRPGVDGVVIKDGMRRATFLPQVWEKVPEPDIFLSMLCQKMGASSDLWRRKKLEVFVYQVEEIHEA
jgi:AmmeMemoRadiSam system protein A